MSPNNTKQDQTSPNNKEVESLYFNALYCAAGCFSLFRPAATPALRKKPRVSQSYRVILA